MYKIYTAVKTRNILRLYPCIYSFNNSFIHPSNHSSTTLQINIKSIWYHIYAFRKSLTKFYVNVSADLDRKTGTCVCPTTRGLAWASLTLCGRVCNTSSILERLNLMVLLVCHCKDIVPDRFDLWKRVLLSYHWHRYLFHKGLTLNNFVFVSLAINIVTEKFDFRFKEFIKW